MYTTIFEFETKEDTNVLVDLINDNTLECTINNNIVVFYEEFESDAEFNLHHFSNLLEEKEIYVNAGIEDNTEQSNINYYDEYGLKEKDFY